MDGVITTIFWASLALLVYVYLGYPLLILALAWRGRGPRRSADHRPTVSVLVPAYNEAEGIGETIRNKLAQDYPPDRLEILVVSDESTDGTDDIVRDIAGTSRVPIRLHRQSPRQGKTAGINTLAELATGEILAFADANSIWDRDALANLVANFADTSVGYVTGKMVYVSDDGSLVGDGCSAYMRYENWLRARETAVGSVVGVDGGVDAMRRDLYTALRADQLPDFVQPLEVVEQGYRVIYEPAARLREPALADSDSEFSMRVRVTLRAFWALKDMRRLLKPARHGVFALQLISHKLLRYTAFIPLALLAATNLALLAQGPVYALAALGQGTFYAAAATGHLRRTRPRLPAWISVPYYFALLNLSCARAALSFLRGERKVLWQPRTG